MAITIATNRETPEKPSGWRIIQPAMLNYQRDPEGNQMMIDTHNPSKLSLLIISPGKDVVI